MGRKINNLDNLDKDLNRLLLTKITVTSDEKNRILQGIHVKKRKSPIGYYSALVAAAVLVCLFTLSQLDFLQNEPGMSDDPTPVILPEEEEPAETPEEVEEPLERMDEEEDTLESPEVEKETLEVPEEKDEDIVVPDEKIPALVDNLMGVIIQTYYDMGSEYNWDNIAGNPPNFEILKPELRKYASESMVEGHLKDITQYFYTPSDANFIPSRDFDIRYTIKENTTNKIVISTIGLQSYLSPAETVYYTVIKEDERWVLDDWQRVGVEEELLNITFEEMKASRESWSKDLEFLEEITHNGEKIYVYKFKNDQYIEAVYASTSEIMFEPLEEWIPEEYR